MLLFFPPGHEPSHVLRPSEAVPALRGVVAPLAKAIREYLAYADLDGDPGHAAARDCQRFQVENNMTLARQLLESWRGAILTADFGLIPSVMIALRRTEGIFLPDEAAGATQETLNSLESILADLGTWTQDTKPPEAPQASQSNPGEGTVNLPSPPGEKPPETAVIDYQAMAAGSGPHYRGCQMQLYVDFDGKLRPFDPSAGECYDLGFGPDRADILDRIAKGVWVRGVLTGTRVRKPVPLPEGYEDDPHLALLTNQGQDLSKPPWGLFYYTRISLAEAYESFDSLGLPIPRSLREDIQDQGQPEAPPASVSDPVGRTANHLPPPSREDAPQGKGKPPGVNEKADALTQTLDLIPLSTHGSNLIKFLAQMTKRTAKVKDLCKHIYKSIDKPTLAKACRLIDRNAEYLEKRDAPLRIVRDKNTREVRLIDR